MLKILIVDDEILVRVGVRGLLPWEEYGFEICGEASDGEEALKAFKVLRPDIVFTDIIMPNMDGLELIRRIKKIDRSTKCVILTCLDEISYVKEAILLGACGYFAKISLDVNQVLELLNRLKTEISEEKGYNVEEGYSGKNYKEDTKEKPEKKGHATDYKRDLGEKIVYDSCFLIDISKGVGVYDTDHFYKHLSGFVSDVMSRYSIKNDLLYVNKNKYVIRCRKEDLDKSISCNSKNISMLLTENISDYFNVDAVITFFNTDITNTIKTMKEKHVKKEENKKNMFDTLTNAIKKMDEASTISIINYISGDKGNYKQVENLKTDALRVLFIFENLLREYSETLDNFFDFDFVSMIINSKDVEEIRSMLISFALKVIDIIANLQESRYRTEVEKIVDYVNLHFNEKITLDYVSKLINMNSSYFSRLFKEETGVGLIEYITNIRIRKAKEYLKRKDTRVNEVSELVGFEDANYFGRVFKRNTGLTPSEYKDKHLK